MARRSPHRAGKVNEAWGEVVLFQKTYTAKGIEAKRGSATQATNPELSQSSTKTATKELF